MHSSSTWFKSILFLGILYSGSMIHADDWPGWRGPRQDGTSIETNVPLEWSESKNVHWRISIPGVGHSSPIVWRDSIFVTTALADAQTRHLLKIDRESGDIVWNRVYRCYTAATGELLKELRGVGAIRASMVSTTDRIYMVAESGRTTVIANDSSWNVLARNEIGEEVVASPAISNGDLIIRSKSSLLLIRDMKR